MKRIFGGVALLLGVACGSNATPNDDVAPRPDASPNEVPGQEDAGAADACAPIAASSEPFSVENERGALGGTLLVPDSCGPMPVVVIVSGSGSSDRDGNVPGDPAKPSVYRVLAEALRDQGVASLRYDDQGIGASKSALPSKIEDFRFEMEVDDEALIVATLKKDARFDRIVVAGHSQGSLTAILGAEKEPVDGFVSLAGSGRPAGQLLREQLAPKLNAEQKATLDEVIGKLEHGEIVGPVEAPLDQVFPVEVQPYLVSWMKYDPKVEIAKLTAPALILQGRFDLQVSERDAALLSDGKPDAQLVYVDDMNHMLRQVEAKTSAAQRASYSQALPLHPTALSTIADFLSGLER